MFDFELLVSVSISDGEHLNIHLIILISSISSSFYLSTSSGSSSISSLIRPSSIERLSESSFLLDFGGEMLDSFSF